MDTVVGKPNQPGTLLILLGVAGLSVTALTVAAAVGYFAVFVNPAGPAQATKRVAREVFTEKVKGKTADEVTAAVGRPDSTTEGIGHPMWVYRDRTYDRVSGKEDSSVFLHFDRFGRVETVSY